jgi:SAM-dependent methyltransferase
VSAADRWRSALEAWALPDELLEAVSESPYGWVPRLWKRRSAASATEERGPTLARVRNLAGRPPADVLDVGAGRGRASLPLVAEGYRLVAVEKDPGMADGLEEEASGLGVRIVRGRWPEAGPEVGTVDVAMCANVVYDVPELVPFLSEMIGRARRGVVVELTETHPWSSLTPWYRALHGLERPAGPTVDDFSAVVEEMTGTEPSVSRWERPGSLWFTGWDEIEEYYGRRLLLPVERRHELRDLLPVVVRDGRYVVGDEERRMATVSFET